MAARPAASSLGSPNACSSAIAVGARLQPRIARHRAEAVTNFQPVQWNHLQVGRKIAGHLDDDDVWPIVLAHPLSKAVPKFVRSVYRLHTADPACPGHIRQVQVPGREAALKSGGAVRTVVDHQ